MERMVYCLPSGDSRRRELPSGTRRPFDGGYPTHILGEVEHGNIQLVLIGFAVVFTPKGFAEFVLIEIVFGQWYIDGLLARFEEGEIVECILAGLDALERPLDLFAIDDLTFWISAVRYPELHPGRSVFIKIDFGKSVLAIGKKNHFCRPSFRKF